MGGGRKSDWVAGLEANLQGWALVLYRGLVDQGQSYDKIKNDLLTAFPGVVDPFRTKNLMKLLNLKREVGEPLPVFYARIDQLVSETYPDLTDESHDLQVRDTFLMKLDSAIALKIANFCNARGDFGPIAVREGANLINMPEAQGANPRPAEENIFLANASGNVGAQTINSGRSLSTGQVKGTGTGDLRCYICAGTWHPVSSCPLYQMIFTCPLCRTEPHAVNLCPLYEEWQRFRAGYEGMGARPRQGVDGNARQGAAERQQNDYTINRQRYQGPRGYGMNDRQTRQYANHYDQSGEGRASRGEFRAYEREYRYRDSRDRGYVNERDYDRFRRRPNPAGNQSNYSSRQNNVRNPEVIHNSGN